jgi:(1->4)-alpha-D-glucan 1-alpha-D-glucosylmutase
MLAEVRQMSPEEALQGAGEGFPKLLVTHRALLARRQRPDCFGPEATYKPLIAEGAKSDHAVAFLRGDGAVTLAPRLVVGLAGDWRGTVLNIPEGRWTNVFTEEAVPSGTVGVAELLRRFPVALMLRN